MRRLNEHQSPSTLIQIDPIIQSHPISTSSALSQRQLRDIRSSHRLLLALLPSLTLPPSKLFVAPISQTPSRASLNSQLSAFGSLEQLPLDLPSMVASKRNTPIFDHGSTLLDPDDLYTSETTRTTVSKAIRNINTSLYSSVPSPNHYVDPVTALGPPPAFGQGIVLKSSQSTVADEDGLDAFGDSPAASTLADRLDFDSCDEDADGEPDDSFPSDHSFWTHRAGDTSVSTVDTVDFDDPPIPLLSRDGKWKGKGKGVEPRLLATRIDAQTERDLRYEDDLAHHQADDIKMPDPSPPKRDVSRSSTRKRTASANSTLSQDGNGRTNTKRKKSGPSGASHNDASTSTQAPSHPATAPKKRPEKKKKAATTTTTTVTTTKKPTQLSSPRPTRTSPRRHHVSHPTSEASIASSASKASTTSSGRYRLRKKDSVPTRSLSALLTPPSDRIFQASVEVVRSASAEWFAAVDHHLTRASSPIRQPEPAEDVVEAAPSAVAETSAEFDELESSMEQVRPVVRDRGTRVLPAGWEMHPGFPLLYQKYHVPSSVSPRCSKCCSEG